VTPDNCISCSGNFFLSPTDPKCVSNTECGVGFYPDTTKNQCLRCSQVCSECFGPSNTKCTVCKPGTLTYYNAGTTTCDTKCPAGTFANTGNYKCEVCVGCTECVESATKCTACPTGVFLYEPYFICVSDCKTIDNLTLPGNMIPRLYGNNTERKCK
jgi:proprotein convertase subtilisin/kexin type 5